MLAIVNAEDFFNVMTFRESGDASNTDATATLNEENLTSDLQIIEDFSICIRFKILYHFPKSYTPLFKAFGPKKESEAFFIILRTIGDSHTLVTVDKDGDETIHVFATYFLPLRWYHMCITHKSSEGIFAIYVDAELVYRTGGKPGNIKLSKSAA